MATGDKSDFFSRLAGLIPASWFGTGLTQIGNQIGSSNTPVRDIILSGPAANLTWDYSLYIYVLLQARIATATGVNLDRISYDFCGTRLPRIVGELDTAYRARIIAEILRPRQTRAAIIKALFDLTGVAPQLMELWNPGDCGAYTDQKNNTVFVSPTLLGHSPAWQGWTTRQVFDPSLLSAAAGGKVFVTFQTDVGTVAGTISAWIGQAALSGDPYDFDGHQVQLLFNNGSGVRALNGAATFVSDPVVFAFDKNRPLIVSAQWGGTTVNLPENPSVVGAVTWYKFAADAATTDATGYVNTGAVNDCIGIARIDSATLNASGYAYDVAGAYGDLSLNNQILITAFRPTGEGIINIDGYDGAAAGYDVGVIEYTDTNAVTAKVSDAQIYAAVAAIMAAGNTGWVAIETNIHIFNAPQWAFNNVGNTQELAMLAGFFF